MKLKIAVFGGDGIGPEVTQEAIQILRAVAELGGHQFTFESGLIGGCVHHGDGLAAGREGAGDGA